MQWRLDRSGNRWAMLDAVRAVRLSKRGQVSVALFNMCYGWRPIFFEVGAIDGPKRRFDDLEEALSDAAEWAERITIEDLLARIPYLARAHCLVGEHYPNEVDEFWRPKPAAKPEPKPVAVNKHGQLGFVFQ